MPAPRSTLPQQSTEPDWTRVRGETVAHLQRLIAIDTTNPPGNELEAARYLAGVLQGAGIDSQLLEAAPGRANLVARLPGTGARAPVLLMAHLDVVGVEREQWTTDPFGGELRDGHLYGRGAIDDKGMLAANLQTLLLLARHVAATGQPLSRDVILLATADEEGLGEHGMPWVIANHPELIRAEFAINEGGRIRTAAGRPLYAAIQTAEKVPYNVTVTAHGTSGHSSVPLPDNPILRLSCALARIAAHREPVHLNPVTEAFFRGLCTAWPDPEERQAMADLTSGDAARERQGAARLGRAPLFDALLRNGISATMVHGGIRSNVIPAEATANLNVRLLPGDSLPALLRRLDETIDDPRVTVEVADPPVPDPPPSPHDSPMYRALEQTLRELSPGLAVVPYMSTGATDSARLRAFGIACYGLLPFPLAPEDEARMHGHDERVPVASLEYGVRLLYGAVLRVAR